MTALSANLNVLSRGEGDLREYLVEDNVHIYKGAQVVIDSSGYARPARNTAGELVVGIADDEFDNTIVGHAAGGRDARGKKGVPVVSGRHFQLTASGTATQASVGQPFFALDDATVRAATGVGNLAGIVTEYVSATQVWVYIPTPVLPVAAMDAVAGVAAGYKVARGVATITGSGTVVTGLATVVAVVATMQADASLTNGIEVTATIGDQAGTPAAGSVILKVWKPTASGDVTPIASAAAVAVNWVAIGT